MAEPIKIRPDLWYAVLCALPPSDYKGVHFLGGVVNELVAPRFPYTKDIYIVVAWQRGAGTFEFYFRVTDQDGIPLLQSVPTGVTMELAGNELTMPYTLTVNGSGLYLLEGFLDNEVTFKTTLRVTQK